MIKLKVVKQFHDKETDTVRKAGEVIEVSDKRGKEILSSKYNVAELVEMGKPDKPNEPPAGGDNGAAPTDSPDGEDLEKLSVKELKAKAEEMGIDTTNLKKKKHFIRAITENRR